MKNENYIYLKKLLKKHEEIGDVLKLLTFAEQEKCKHYHYDDEAFEMSCDIVSEMEDMNDACLKCTKFEVIIS